MAPVEAVAGLHGLDDGVGGLELEHERHVPELEVGVDEHDGLDGPLGQCHGQVDGDAPTSRCRPWCRTPRRPGPASGDVLAGAVGAGARHPRPPRRDEARAMASRSSASSADTATTSSTPARSACCRTAAVNS